MKAASLLTLLLPLAHPAFVEFRRDLARSYATDDLFLTDATDVVSDVSWLQSYRRTSTSGATNGGFPPVTCTEVTIESVRDSANAANVVVGISSCLSDATIAKIRDWFAAIVKSKPTYWRNDASAVLKFKFVLHVSTCAPFSENIMVRSRLSRLDGFKPYGSVTSALPSPNDDVTAAVMFFEDDGSGPFKDSSAYKALTDYEEKAKVRLAYNFQVNELANGATPSTIFSNAKYLSSINELAKYSLFTTATRYTCVAKLPNSKPFPFLDASGNKQCICTCPSGYEMMQANSKLSCVKLSNPEPPSDVTCGTCIWDAFGPLKFEVTESLKTCDLSALMVSSGMPVPYLMTTNVEEGKSTDASRQVTLTSTQQFSPVYSGDDIASFLYTQQKLSGKIDRDALLLRRPLQLPRAFNGQPKYTPSGDSSSTKTSTTGWSKYQETPPSIFAKIPFTGYGKYKIVATAVDSYRKDSCTGCLAVVDQNRPYATTQCPEPFCDPGAADSVTVGGSSNLLNAELTAANLVKADASVQQILAFQSNASNDACSVNNRCDDELFELRNFFTDRFVAGGSKFADSRECFAPKHVWSDFLSSSIAQQALFADGSKLQADIPVNTNNAQCTRCCRVNVALKERWVDYLCDSTYDTERCDGRDSETCAYAQCLTLSGPSMLKVNAQVRDSVMTESENVLKELAYTAATSYSSVVVPPTEIHRALLCTRFGEKDDDSCRFRSKVSALLSTTTAFHSDWASFTGGKDANSFVFWRYRIAGDPTWRLMSSASAIEHTFAQSETQISVEAWSQCGLVRAFAFRVYLHVHTPVRVCERFDMMWYQTSANPLKLTDAPLCNIPKSDFVELTFDYQSGFGLEATNADGAMALHSSVVSVVCSASINSRKSVEIVRAENASSFDIVRRFAVQLQALPTTSAITTLSTTCTFKLARYDKSTTMLTCSKTFSLKDCDAPCANASSLRAMFSAASAIATCASKQQPGPYEACGSTVLSSTSTQTQLAVTSDVCCQSCGSGVASACVGVVAVPNNARGTSAGLRRCEPQAPTSAWAAALYMREAFAHAAAAPALAAAATLALGLVALHRWKRKQEEQLARDAENAELIELLARGS